MLEIALVSDQHDHNVRIRMVTEFLQPAMHVLVCRMLGNVVDKKRSHGTSVVAVCKSVSMTVCTSTKSCNSRRRDSSVPFLTRCYIGGI